MSNFALFVGHSRRGDRTGAVSVSGVSEHAFNTPLAYRVAEILRDRKHSATVFDSYDADNYADAMAWVGSQAGLIRADAAVEFHFNSGSPSASGFEYLFWGSSRRAKRLAESFVAEHATKFPNSRNRGAKPLGPMSRGALFLRRTPCPAVILEPFFGSNVAEMDLYSSSREELARVYADALCNWAVAKS